MGLNAELKKQNAGMKINALIKRFRDALTDEHSMEKLSKRKRGRNNIKLTFTSIEKED